MKKKKQKKNLPNQSGYREINYVTFVSFQTITTSILINNLNKNAQKQ